MIPVACFVKNNGGSRMIKSSRVVSRPDAHIEVTEYELTEEARKALTVPFGSLTRRQTRETVAWYEWPVVIMLAAVMIVFCRLLGVHAWLMDTTESNLPMYGGRERRERCVACNALKVKP